MDHALILAVDAEFAYFFETVLAQREGLTEVTFARDVHAVVGVEGDYGVAPRVDNGGVSGSGWSW